MTRKQREIILKALGVCQVYLQNDLHKFEHTPQWAYDVAKQQLSIVDEAIRTAKLAK